MADTAAPRKNLSRAALIALAAVFFAPLLGATFLYYWNDSLPLPGSAAHGELIHPARPIEQLALVNRSGEPLDENFLRGRWTLVYLGSERCDLYCEASLFKMRQVRLSLGRDLGRVQRLFVQTASANLSDLDEILARHPRMMVASPREPAGSPLLGVFGDESIEAVYLVDPLGNLMMRYGSDATSKGMLKDLKRLLKNSRIG
ncbi:MAG: SCO family protein [Gammaproteobacteria bacterium]